jgi:phospholipase C
MTSLDKIEHFVVLMLENRSFDHMFGFRRGVEGLKGKETNRVNGFAPVHPTDDAPFEIPTKHALGPLHNVFDVNLQLFGSHKDPSARQKPTMEGFVASYLEGFNGDVHRKPTQEELKLVMQSFAPGALPAITALADSFVLCDHWFCEVPGPTHPNRLYIHAGTSAGFAHNVFKRDFPLLTIYELLEKNGQSWATYDFDDNEVLRFTRIQKEHDRFRHFDPQFLEDVDNGTLPNYSFIVPRFLGRTNHPSNSQHAPHDVRPGDLLIADIYNALVSNNALWNKTCIIVTYDENGGFYDHVPPPSAVNPDGKNSPQPDDSGRPAHRPPPVFKFDRLGPRVPTLIASPWIGQAVCSDQLQHTSVLRTVRERFGISRSLSKREEAAKSFASLFNQTKARTNFPASLPKVPMPTVAEPDHHSNPANLPLDDLQKDMRDGVISVTQRSHPEDEDKIWLPKTQGETSDFIRQRWARHHDFLRTHHP